VIGEMFLEGKALFDLSQLLAYRQGKFDPRPSLEKVSRTPEGFFCSQAMWTISEKCSVSCSHFYKYRWNNWNLL